jgi:Tol biopolymer transport system component
MRSRRSGIRNRLLLAFIPIVICVAALGSTGLVSRQGSSVTPSTTGNGESVAPQITPDGRFILFPSTATDLVTNDNSFPSLDLFLKDRASGTMWLISQTLEGYGGDRDSTYGVCSTNGRFVAFQSEAAGLVANDTNGLQDVFLRDVWSNTTYLVSRTMDGGNASGASYDPALSADGRYVAFVSLATNLISLDTNGIVDVFVHDTLSNLTVCASPGALRVGSADPAVDSPVLTPDGRFAAYFSSATGLVSGVSNISRGEIYLRDLQQETTTWISSNALSLVRSNVAFAIVPVPSHPTVSEDGRFVAFKCGWTNGPTGTPGGTAPVSVVLRCDTLTGLTTVISTNGFPPYTLADDVFGPEMTPDGRFVAFVAREASGSVINSSVWLWDAVAGTNTLVSVDLTGVVPTNGISHTPSLSADGAYVAFLSSATNLVTNTVSPGFHVYLRELGTATTHLVDVDTNGASFFNQAGSVPRVSSDGKLVVFESLNDGLTAVDKNDAQDVFLHAFTSNQVEAISTRSSGLGSSAGNKLSMAGGLATPAAGARMVFSSYASDLVTNDFNRELDVFLYDASTQANRLVSSGLDGNAGAGGASHSPSLSVDGRYVVYVSAATNLISNDTNGVADIFRFDLLTGSNQRVNVSSNGTPVGTADAKTPIITPDGRFLAFSVQTTTASVYWRDLDANVTRTLTSTAMVNRRPSITDDGQRVAYTDSQGRLYVWEASAQANIWTNIALVRSWAISPAGNAVLYQATNQMFVRSFNQNTNVLLGASKTSIQSSSPWSRDGRFVVFTTTSGLIPIDVNNTNDVYLYDLQTRNLILLSMGYDGVAGANGPSDWPSFSHDGRCIVYRSFASNILATNAGLPVLILFDRQTGRSSLAAHVSNGITPYPWISQAMLSTNGSLLTFQGSDSGIAQFDFNQSQDVFAASLAFVSLIDTDGDGIPDWWTQEYFGHAIGEEFDLSRAQNDTDNDGMTNHEEFMAGTNPTDPNSVFKLTIAPTNVSGTNVVLTWTALPGKSYQVQYTETLDTIAWQTFPGNPVIAGNTGYLFLGATATNRYFRAVLGN